MLPWLEPVWLNLLQAWHHLPHAVLLAAPAGLGSRDLAEALAARLLCARPPAQGVACDHCPACRLRLQASHPDLFRIVPESEQEEGAASKTVAAEEGRGSSQIVIARIRVLQQELTLTGSQGNIRAVIVDPAEAMNAYTANALLKLLEEPPSGTYFILVSYDSQRLLPTVISRCQQWRIHPPSAGQLQQWLQQQPELNTALLAVSGGMPLEALRLQQNGLADFFVRFIQDVVMHKRIDAPVQLASSWNDWLRSKAAARQGGFDFSMLCDWMQRWLADLLMCKLGGEVRFFPQNSDNIHNLTGSLKMSVILNCYNEVSQIKFRARHPLNQQLAIEDMLLRYSKMLNG